MNKNRISKKDKKRLDDVFINGIDAFQAFMEEHEVFMNKSNQQAGKRARVASIQLTHALKKYRKESMKIASKLPIKVPVSP